MLSSLLVYVAIIALIIANISLFAGLLIGASEKRTLLMRICGASAIVMFLAFALAGLITADNPQQQTGAIQNLLGLVAAIVLTKVVLKLIRRRAEQKQESD